MALRILSIKREILQRVSSDRIYNETDGVSLNGDSATFPLLYNRVKFRVPACVCTCFVRGCEILSPTFEATFLNPTDSEKAIVKAGSARRLGQLFSGDGPQSSAMTSRSLSMHNTFQELSTHGRLSKANINGILKNVETSLILQDITNLIVEVFSFKSVNYISIAQV